MTIQRKHGQWGENLASEYLVKSGFQIVTRNWRYKRAEIDIIAREQQILVFIEVKTLSSPAFGSPESRISSTKKRLIIDAAMAYMRTIDYEWEIRFDVVAIHGETDQEHEIVHFRDAFFPGIDYKG